MKEKNNIRSGILAVLLLIPLFLILTSCNLILSLPRGRENINDPAAQITAFTAVPSGDKSVVTMWNWKDSNYISSEERIDEIKIMHSITGYPDINVPFAGQKYDNNSEWQYEWHSLIGGITHYFSLFAKDNDGNWYAPLRAKAKLPGTTESNITYTRQIAFNYDNAGNGNSNPSTLNVRNSEWVVIFFDLPTDAFIVNAQIKMVITPNPLCTEITFAALDGILPDNDLDKWYCLQDNSIVNESAAATFNINQPSYNITEVVRAASIGSTNAILIKTMDASDFTIDNTAVSPPIIIADIIK